MKWLQVVIECVAAGVLLGCAFMAKDASTSALWGAVGGWYLYSMLDSVQKALSEK